MTSRSDLTPREGEACECGRVPADPYSGLCEVCLWGPMDDDHDLECTHCGGEGLCWDGSDPLGNCADDPHRCHACTGSGKRKDQTVF